MPHGRLCRHSKAICLDCALSCRLDDQRRNRKTVSHGVKRAHNQTLRKQALARDGRRCRLSEPGCTLTATTVHLRPDLAGNHDVATLADLVSACAHCHGVVDARRSRHVTA